MDLKEPPVMAIEEMVFTRYCNYQTVNVIAGFLLSIIHGC